MSWTVRVWKANFCVTFKRHEKLWGCFCIFILTPDSLYVTWNPTAFWLERGGRGHCSWCFISVKVSVTNFEGHAEQWCVCVWDRGGDRIRKQQEAWKERYLRHGEGTGRRQSLSPGLVPLQAMHHQHFIFILCQSIDPLSDQLPPIP